MENECFNEIAAVLYQLTPRLSKKTCLLLKASYENGFHLNLHDFYLNKYDEKNHFGVGSEFLTRLENLLLRLREYYFPIRNEVLYKLEFILNLENEDYHVNLVFMPNRKLP